MSSTRRSGRRHGPEPRWGGRRWPLTVNWPEAHRELYEAEAKKAGVSVNEYCIRVMASAHGLLPDQQDQQEEDGPESGQLQLTG